VTGRRRAASGRGGAADGSAGRRRPKRRAVVAGRVRGDRFGGGICWARRRGGWLGGRAGWR
jgi:hypothetical protein